MFGEFLDENSLLGDRRTRVLEHFWCLFFRAFEGQKDRRLTKYLRCSTKNSCEQKLQLHLLFIDFRQAYDLVLRSKVYKAMKYLRPPKKIIRLVEMTLKDTRSKNSRRMFITIIDSKSGFTIRKSAIYNNIQPSTKGCNKEECPI